MSRYARVIVAYDDAYPDPISGQRGDMFCLGRHDERYPEFIWATAADGGSGWVPQSFLRRDGDVGRLIRDYAAESLTVDAGEIVEIQDAIGGWLWVATADGFQGWIPASSVALQTGRNRPSADDVGACSRSTAQKEGAGDP